MVGSPKLHFDSFNKDKTPKIYTCTLQYVNNKYSTSFTGQSHGIDGIHHTIDT
jgi:hypothetical protein